MKTSLPIVNLDGVVLREVRSSDIYDYYIIGSDALTCKELNWGPFMSISDAEYVINNVILQRPYYGLPIGYAITINDKMIGLIDIHTYYETNNSAEVGYILRRDYWSLGIMTKSLKALINVSFYYLGLSKLLIGHTINNIASKKVILKCGFKYSFDKYILMKNEYKLCNFYILNKYDWRNFYVNKTKRNI